MPDTALFRQQFLEALINQDLAGGIDVIKRASASELPPAVILLEVISSAMDEIGRKQADREITLSEVYVIARISETAIENVLSQMDEKPASAGTVVIGTVAGDYHGLGRKIVASFLRVAGFEVIDLGVSVLPERFVDAAVEHKAPVICVSALLLHTARRVADVRRVLKERGLEKDIRLVVGGAALNFDRRLYREIGADATARNAADAVSVVRLLMGASK